MIRDPVERAISSYSYWRHRISTLDRQFYLPMVQAAKTPGFADFIRSGEQTLKRNLFNTHYTHLAGGALSVTACEPEHQAEYARKVASLAAEFDVIGVTERLPESLHCFLAAIGFREPINLPALLARTPRNASPPPEPNMVSQEDRAFIMERNRLDFALHAIAAERLDRALRDRRWAAFKFRWARS